MKSWLDRPKNTYPYRLYMNFGKSQRFCDHSPTLRAGQPFLFIVQQVWDEEKAKKI